MKFLFKLSPATAGEILSRCSGGLQQFSRPAGKEKGRPAKGGLK